MLILLHIMVTDNAMYFDVTQTLHMYIILTIFYLYSSNRHRQ